MKHLKYFESRIQKNPRRGDYVIVNAEGQFDNLQYKEGLKEFLDTNVGKVDYIYNTEDDDGNEIKELTVSFLNVPSKLKWWFESNNYRNKTNYYLRFNIKNIISFGKTPEELEHVFNSKKYNL